MTVQYLGHSCFKLTDRGFSVIVDPYQENYVPGLQKLNKKADRVFCSHDHADHNAAREITVTGNPAPADFTTEEMLSDHDEKGGKLRGKTLLRVFDFSGIRIAHLGDLGRELNKAELDFLHDIDCLLIPVGGHYTIDTDQAIAEMKRINARVTIPMHYRKNKTGYDVLQPIELFISKTGCEVLNTSSIELHKNENKRIVVLTAEKED